LRIEVRVAQVAVAGRADYFGASALLCRAKGGCATWAERGALPPPEYAAPIAPQRVACCSSVLASKVATAVGTLLPVAR